LFGGVVLKGGRTAFEAAGAGSLKLRCPFRGGTLGKARLGGATQNGGVIRQVRIKRPPVGEGKPPRGNSAGNGGPVRSIGSTLSSPAVPMSSRGEGPAKKSVFG